ncbi:MAG: hypothetical protein ACRD1M_16400 [Terriglobales bacterium]
MTQRRQCARSGPAAGGLPHNIISHPVAAVAEFLPSQGPEAGALGFADTEPRAAEENGLADELRVIVAGGGTTAYLTFSSQMRPSLHVFRIFGPKNGIVVDQDQQTVVRLRGARRKSCLEKFVSPAATGRQHMAGAAANVGRFLRGDLHMSGDTQFLVRSLYEAVAQRRPAPVSEREILLTARVMDEIFAQLAARRQAETPAPVAVQA